MPKQKGHLLLAGLILSAAPLWADVRMPAIFGDHMVLQQGITLSVWGWANAGEEVSVTLGSKSAKTKADAEGKWRVDFEKAPTASAPMTVTVTGKNTLTFEDVLVGEVWVCSGQSNMAYSLPHPEEARDSQIRFFEVPKRAKLQPETDIPGGKWVVCTPETAGKFSAVAYFFARELRSTLKRPMGLIGTYWVGSGGHGWVSMKGFRKEPLLKCYTDAYDQYLPIYPQKVAIYPALTQAYNEAKAQWGQEYGSKYAEARKKWGAEWSRTQKAGLPDPPKPPMPPSAPAPPVPPDGGGRIPSTLFNGMVAPIIPYGIKGVIWYQGESNHARPIEYKTLLSCLINDWRENWGEGDFPFLVVQLPNYMQSPQDLPFVRESQFKAVQTAPHTGLAVTIDVGEPYNLHPPNKLYVGLRLALAARHIAYGQDLVYSGPIYDTMKVEGNAIRVTFTHVGSGLTIGSAPYQAAGVTPLPTTVLVGFKIAGEDKTWVPADAKIDGNSVVISSPQVSTPVAVRYAWESAPQCNLYNKEGLPASPFRTDDWVPEFKTDDWNPYHNFPAQQPYEKGVKVQADTQIPGSATPSASRK